MTDRHYVFTTPIGGVEYELQEFLSLDIPTPPRAQPRPRLGRTSTGASIIHSNNARSAGMKKAIIAHCASRLGRQPDPTIPIYLEVEFVMPVKRKALHGRLHVGKPDADNLLKTLKDGLVRAGALHDDSQVAAVEMIKVYGPHPGMVRIRMYTMT